MPSEINTRPRVVITFDQLADIEEHLYRGAAHLPEPQRRMWAQTTAIGVADVLRNGLSELSPLEEQVLNIRR